MTASPLSLRRNFSWTLLGNLLYAACLWGILSVLTKLGAPATVGRFALASAVASPVIMFAGLQLRSALVADADGSHEFRDYLTVRVVALPLALLVVWGIALRAYAPEQVTAIMLFGLARCVDQIGDIFYGVPQKNDRMDIVATSRMIKGVSALFGFGLTFHLTGSLNLALIAMAVAWLIPLLAYDIPQARRLNHSLQGMTLRPAWRPHLATRIVWTTLPLGFVILLSQMRQTIPRTALEAAFNEETVGIYAALSYVVIAGSAIVMALGQSSLARLSQYFANDQLDAFRRLGLRLALLGVVLGLAAVLLAWFAGPLILTILYRPEYAVHSHLFILIMAAGGVFYVSTLLAPMTTAMRAFRGQMLVLVIQVLILAALAPILIPRYGMMGAAGTVMAGSLWTVLGFALLIGAGLKQKTGWRNRWVVQLFR